MGHISQPFFITHNAKSCVFACVIGSLDSTELIYTTKAQAGRPLPQGSPPSSTKRLSGRFVWHVHAADALKVSWCPSKALFMLLRLRSLRGLHRNCIPCESSVTCKTDSTRNSQDRPLKAEIK